MTRHDNRRGGTRKRGVGRSNKKYAGKHSGNQPCDANGKPLYRSNNK